MKRTTRTGLWAGGAALALLSAWLALPSVTQAAIVRQISFSNILGSVTDAQVPNTITVNLAAAATALAADPADCAAGQVATGIGTSGALACTASPSLTTVTAALAGNATTATALAADGANCAAGSYPLGVGANGAVQSCATPPDISASWREHGRRLIQCQIGLPIGGGANGWSCNGPTVPTNTCIGGTVGNTDLATGDTTRHYHTYLTNAVINTACGPQATMFVAMPAYRPTVHFRFRTAAVIDQQRIWAGITESTLIAVAVPTGAAASAVDYIGIGQEDTSGPNFYCSSGDGTNHSGMDTGVVATVNTPYEGTLNWSTAGTLICTLNGVSVTKTSNLSVCTSADCTSGLAIQASVTSLVALTARQVDFAQFEVELN